MGYYEESWDEDGNPEPGTWVKEEPDCGTCCDRGYILLDAIDEQVPWAPVDTYGAECGVSMERCPDCNPTQGYEAAQARGDGAVA